MDTQHPAKRALWLTVVGALVGALLSTWVAPKMIAWYWTPPAQMGITCVEPINWALNKLQIAQAVGIGLGAVAGIAAFFAWFKKKAAKAAA
jgi:hypothetical protein